jgi:hypothetical protein
VGPRSLGAPRSSCCGQGTATGAQGCLGGGWGESLELALPDSDLVWSKEEIRRGRGWWWFMSPSQCRSVAFEVRAALLELGLGCGLPGGRSEAT